MQFSTPTSSLVRHVHILSSTFFTHAHSLPLPAALFDEYDDDGEDEAAEYAAEEES
jgi:hypothetical protein